MYECEYFDDDILFVFFLLIIICKNIEQKEICNDLFLWLNWESIAKETNRLHIYYYSL